MSRTMVSPITAALLLALLGTGAVIAWLAARARRHAGDLEDCRRRTRELADEVETLRVARERILEAQDLAGLRTWEWEMAGPAESWVAQTFRLLSFGQGDDPHGRKESIRAIHPKDREGLRDAISGALASGRPLQASFRSVGREGEVRHLQARASVRRDPGGGPPRLIGTVLDVTELKLAEEALRRAAATDGLTGAYTRNHFFELAHRELERRRRYGGQTAVMMVDVDAFKGLNDAFGHAFGDRVLKTLVDTIRQTLRRSDILGRYGGDEFAVVLPNTSPGEAAEIAERLRDRVEGMALPLSGEGGATTITVSIGTAAVTDEDQDMEEVLKRADRGLYAAKAAGRDRVAAG